jgi:hypothetical protein
MQRILLLSIFLLNIFATGCSVAPPQYKTSTQEDGMPIHGNFCGKNVPTIVEADTNRHIHILESINTIDKLDEACKQHDICYTKNGYYNADCDKQLSDRAGALSNQFSDPGCQQLAAIIRGYFETSNINLTRKTWANEKSGTIKKIILTPFSILADAMTGVATAAMLVVNTASTALVDTVETISPFPTTRDKRIQYPVPPRYKQCK